MKKIKWSHITFTLLLSAFAFIVVLTALNYSREARLIPMIIGIIAMAFSVFITVGEIYPDLMKFAQVNPVDLITRDSEKRIIMEKPGKSKGNNEIFKIFGWFFSFLVLIYLIGFLISICTFILLFLKFYGNTSWIKAIAISIAMFVFIYVVFEILMSIELFRGVLFGAIVPPI
jgi:hypothetical protein